MRSVEEALQIILTKVGPLSAMEFPLEAAVDHLLAEDVRAPEELPAFSNSAMDGYAVRSGDIDSAPKDLCVAGELPAGQVFSRAVESGEAVRIMTGAPVPPGADAVVPVEETEPASEGRVRILKIPRAGQHIRLQGEEVKRGDIVLSKGKRLSPADVGLAASLGITRLKVIRRPSVRLVTTGSEVVDPSVSPRPGQIRNSNLIAVASAVRLLGCPLLEARHAADDPSVLKKILSGGDADVLITCGGVSVGDFDFVKDALSELGEIYFWKVAIKPGKPFVFGRLGRSWLFGLPGNPVSALVAFDVFVKPALLALAGVSHTPPQPVQAALSEPVRHKPGRRLYLNVRLENSDGGLVARPISWQGSGMLRSLTESNAWAILSEQGADLPAGSPVSVLPRE